MKIKTKKEMNLPELIEWGWKNIEQVRGKVFKSHIKDMFGDYSTVQFSVDGYGFKTDRVSYNATFTVEVEEEITEDTAIHKLVELSDKGLLGRTILNINSSINLAKTDKSVAFYILNDDLTMTLIWTRENGLVD